MAEAGPNAWSKVMFQDSKQGWHDATNTSDVASPAEGEEGEQLSVNSAPAPITTTVEGCIVRKLAAKSAGDFVEPRTSASAARSAFSA